MITIRDFMETVDYRITQGSDYGWQCYGPYAYSLDSWTGPSQENGHSISIVFDTTSQTVFEATAYDYAREKAYRLINPLVRVDHDQEAKAKGVDAKQAWDHVEFVDLETDEDFLLKARAIAQGQKDYDTRVQVPLELPDHELLRLMLMAHQKDITFNQLAENAIKEFLDQHDIGARAS